MGPRLSAIWFGAAQRLRHPGSPGRAAFAWSLAASPVFLRSSAGGLLLGHGRNSDRLATHINIKGKLPFLVSRGFASGLDGPNVSRPPKPMITASNAFQCDALTWVFAAC